MTIEFTTENTIGYTNAQLAALNAELEQRVAGLEIGSDEYNAVAKSFADEVSSR